MKRLLVLRHAKSSWADSGLADWERPLNDRGRRDAPRAGEWLRTRAIVPDLVITSDAVRARRTAEAVAAAAGYSAGIAIEPSLYLAAPAQIAGVLAALAASPRSVLIVGHNPGLEDFVSAISGQTCTMATAALVDLAVPIDQWSELDLTTAASIVDTWQPREQGR